MNEKLTKAEIIENIHDKLGADRKDIHAIIDEFFEEVKEALANGRTTELRGFGTFEVRIRKGRDKARNPNRICRQSWSCSIQARKRAERYSLGSSKLVFFSG